MIGEMRVRQLSPKAQDTYFLCHEFARCLDRSPNTTTGPAALSILSGGSVSRCRIFPAPAASTGRNVGRGRKNGRSRPTDHQYRGAPSCFCSQPPSAKASASSAGNGFSPSQSSLDVLPGTLRPPQSASRSDCLTCLGPAPAHCTKK